MIATLVPQSRRTFIRNVLSATAAAFVGPGCGVFGPPGIEEIGHYLAGLIRHPQAAADIGSSVLQTDAAIRSMSPEQLTALILRETGLGDVDRLEVSLDEIGRILKKRVRQDFADETVVTVNGWLLSQTEARLCALVKLQRSAES
jgi:hypothetical protein